MSHPLATTRHVVARRETDRSTAERQVLVQWCIDIADRLQEREPALAAQLQRGLAAVGVNARRPDGEPFDGTLFDAVGCESTCRARQGPDRRPHPSRRLYGAGTRCCDARRWSCTDSRRSTVSAEASTATPGERSDEQRRHIPRRTTWRTWPIGSPARPSRTGRASSRTACGTSWAAPGSTATVVAVGEKKRGKSSLINALVGLTSSRSTWTSLPACTSPSTTPRTPPHGCTTPRGPRGGRSGSTTSPSTRPVLITGRACDYGVSQVAVLSPSPLLARGLTLIDTPGVGGLTAGHAAITLATLDRADALLFVVNGHTELTASELAFLERATERVSVVLFVLTQFDQAPEWRAVLARNRELIAGHAPRHANAPWFVVNSRARSDASTVPGRRAAPTSPSAARGERPARARAVLAGLALSMLTR